ncbi:MAG: GTP-binding protein [Planctomycetes bacterium]|nr:GTP-binding protein [Planctomycetota bacterium]
MPGEAPDPRTPVTLLTGWLGAGKTTLLNRVLAEPAGRRFAVLVNEFGDIGIDDRLVVRADEDLVELNNGCVCCTVRGDLVRTLIRLRRRRPPFFRRREFDHVLIETTGIAEPAPLLRTFLVEEDIAVCYRIESIIGVADAQSLDNALHEPSAVEQLALADLLLLNKVDLCTLNAANEAAHRLQLLNPAAPIVRCEQGRAPIKEILRARTPRGLEDLQSPVAPASDGTHAHQTDIEALSLRSEHPLDSMKVQLWLDACAKMLEGRLIRYKGFLDLAGEKRRGILQGVYELYTVSYGSEWREDESRTSELVFIGRDLDAALLERGMRACVADF